MITEDFFSKVCKYGLLTCKVWPIVLYLSAPPNDAISVVKLSHQRGAIGFAIGPLGPLLHFAATSIIFQTFSNGSKRKPQVHPLEARQQLNQLGTSNENLPSSPKCWPIFLYNL